MRCVFGAPGSTSVGGIDTDRSRPYNPTITPSPLTWGVPVPKINVYLPDELAEAVRDAHIPVSAVCQAALERSVREITALREEDDWTTGDARPEGTLAAGRFVNFTPRARRVLVLAQDAARRLGHDYIGTEHLLLGVIEEGGNLALRVLECLEIDPGDLRAELEASIESGSSSDTDRLPFTPQAKKSLDLASQEAVQLGHNYVGCEHLLLGLVAEDKGLAGRVLRRLGVELRVTRRATVTALLGYLHRHDKGRPPTAYLLQQIVRRLGAIEQRLSG